MIRIRLLFGLLALANGQLIYPDQYERMKTSTIPSYAYSNDARASGAPVNYPVLQAANSQPAQSVPQFGAAPAAARPVYLTTTISTPVYPSAGPATNPASMEENWRDHVNNIIAKGIVKFSLDLDKAIYNTRGASATASRENMIFSPLSVTVALALVLLGSAGRTFNEISQVLGLKAGVDISQHSEVVHQMFGELLSIINNKVEGSNAPRVDSASGIFVQEGYPIRSAFGAISENVYKSEVINLDFQKRGREAQEIINNWVKQRTMGKITSILNSTPSPLTNVILLSALYFKGEWNQHFMNGQTKRKEFFIEPNNAVEVDMMYNGGTFPFYEDKSLGVKILALPYKGLEMSMYILLPKAEGATALKNFRDQLTVDIIENLISNLKNQTCIVGLPRMKISSTLSLNQALQSLGLRSLFDPATADLSLLSDVSGQDSAAAAVPLTTQRPIPMTSPPSIPQTLPQALPQIAPQRPLNAKSNDVLIFPRGLEANANEANNNGLADGTKRSYFRYDDKRHGVSVEQWDTGFHIRKIRRTYRDVMDRRQHNTMSSRATHVTENEDIEKVTPKVSDENTRYVSLEENKYRFQKAEKKTNNRKRRQTRPMDESFLRFIQSQNFPSYGLDDLRNSANLVNPHLFAHEVLHKVEIEVTEKGTEAAAVTGVILERDGNQKRLIANRPFIFFIRHDFTKLVLFWGTINTPTPNYAIVR